MRWLRQIAEPVREAANEFNESFFLTLFVQFHGLSQPVARDRSALRLFVDWMRPRMQVRGIHPLGENAKPPPVWINFFFVFIRQSRIVKDIRVITDCGKERADGLQ